MKRPGLEYTVLTRHEQDTLQHCIGHYTAVCTRSHYIIQNDRIRHRHSRLDCIERLQAYLLEREVN